MVTPVYSEAQKQMWRKIWDWKGVILRVKTFIWRAMHNGLPTMQALHMRIDSIRPKCPRCQMENEYVMHWLFFCPLARAVWFASPISLKVEALPLQFPNTLKEITHALEEDQLVLFANLLWCLWKARNEEIFQGKKNSPTEVIKKAKAMEKIPKSAPAGAFTAFHPIEAEALALLWALNYIAKEQEQWGGNKYACYGDCKNLVTSVQNNNLEDLPHWKAAETVAQCTLQFQRGRNKILVQHVPREVIQEAHRMANWARQTRNLFTGLPNPTFMQQMQMQRNINSQWFTAAQSQ